MWRDGVKTRLTALEHPAWGEDHYARLYAMCRQIADAEELDVDDDVLFATAWYHDVGTFGQYACEGMTPPQCAAQAARSELPETGFPAEKLDTVAEIIAAHGFDGDAPERAEARVLRDADMLEFLGVIGIVRLLAIVEDEEWVPDVQTAVQLAAQFNNDLPGRLIYDTTREIAISRMEEHSAFMGALSAESDNFRLLHRTGR